MKIAIIGTAYPYRGGLAAFTERLARELLGMGHEVIIYTFTVQYPNFLFPGKTQYLEEAGPEGLTIIRAVNSVNPFNWIAVGNKIRKANYDIVVATYWLPFMGPSLGTILRRIKKNRFSKIISLVHNMIPHERRPGDKQFSQYFVKPIEGHMALSSSVLNDIKAFDSTSPTMLSPHPLFDNFGEAVSREEALQYLGLSSADQYILFFGFIRKYKGLDLLLEAFADPRFRDTNIKLLIAGEYYADREYYDALIKKYGLSDVIIPIEKFIPDTEVKYYFNASDLLVQPYKSATQSGVTQIAYHFELPMVVTNVGGLEEMCPDGKVAYVVAPKAAAIADAMYRYFFETDRTQMVQAMQIEKQKYSWSLFANRLLDLADKIDK